MTVFEIPLRPGPQTFTVQLAGVEYTMTLRWHASSLGGWFLDIADDQSAPILSGVPLVTGADLLAQYAHLGFGGKLGVQTDHDLFAPPTFDTLGQTSHIYFVTP